MRLFEAILEANHRALKGDPEAGIHPTEFANDLPVVALTCIDPRLNPLMPSVLGIKEEDFIWLRNAGNIVTGPMSSTVRSLAMACAVKNGKEIALIGHTDCRVPQTSVSELVDRFRALGIDRRRLPDNLTEYFGLFASERQNVLKGVEIVRSSPLIGPRVPVHGLLVDIRSGGLEWLANGYEAGGRAGTQAAETSLGATALADMTRQLAAFNLGEMKLPDIKIGEFARISANTPQQPQTVAVPEAEPPPTPEAAPKAEPARPIVQVNVDFARLLSGAARAVKGSRLPPQLPRSKGARKG